MLFLMTAVHVLLRIPLVLLLTWSELAKLHLSAVWTVMMWAVAVATLPVRVAGAIRRERELEAQLLRAQREAERANALLRRLRKERKMMELIVRDLEADLDKAIARNKNLNFATAKKKEKKPNKPDAPRQSHVVAGGAKSNAEHHHRRRHHHHHNHEAVTRSVFTAALCVSVGVVMWEGGEGCVRPLSAGLLAVVAISMKSVVQVISAADSAVILLSFNCFVLGAFTYPALHAAI